MRNISLVAITLFAVLSTGFLGCSNKDYALAPVSGTVTFEGKPVEKLRVTFSPEPVGDNFAVGPYSIGVSDSEGKFSLKTRYKESGAVVGNHKLSFEYSDVSETAMADLRAALSDARDSGSKEEFEKTRKMITDLQAKLKGRPVLKDGDKVIVIPADGHEDLKIDLGEMIGE